MPSNKAKQQQQEPEVNTNIGRTDDTYKVANMRTEPTASEPTFLPAAVSTAAACESLSAREEKEVDIRDSNGSEGSSSIASPTSAESPRSKAYRLAAMLEGTAGRGRVARARDVAPTSMIFCTRSRHVLRLAASLARPLRLPEPQTHLNQDNGTRAKNIGSETMDMSGGNRVPLVVNGKAPNGLLKGHCAANQHRIGRIAPRQQVPDLEGAI